MALRSSLINVMEKAARKAARGLLHDFGEVEQLQVSRKGPADFVSAADIKAEKTLRFELEKARPDFGFILEEGGEVASKDNEHRWLIDPLDGTTNFLHGIPHFCINIAVEKFQKRPSGKLRREIIAGITFDPIRDELFWAEKGQGAYLNERRLRVSGRTKLAESLVRERELDLLLSESHFQRYVGIKPPALIPPKVPRFTSYANINLQNNWHYKAVEHQHAAAMLEEKTMRSKSGPRVYLEGRGDVGNNVDGIQGRNNGASLMVTASWSIFDGGQRKADVQQANADVQRQQAILDETLVILQHDSQARWDDYRTRSEHISILKKYHEDLVKTIDLYRQQFELGTRPLLSILDIQSEAIGAKIRIADEERDWADSGYHLLYFSGQLIPRTVGEGYISTPRAADGKTTSQQLP